MAHMEGIKPTPRLPVPPGPGAYSSAPPGSDPDGPIPQPRGLFVDTELIARPYEGWPGPKPAPVQCPDYFLLYFTIGSNQGLSWEEEAKPCVTRKDLSPSVESVGLGPPTVVVLPEKDIDGRHKLRMYFAEIYQSEYQVLVGFGRWEVQTMQSAKLNFAFSYDGKIWTREGSADISALGLKANEHIQDMAVIYGCEGSLLTSGMYLHFFFQLNDHKLGNIKSPLIHAVTQDGETFTPGNNDLKPTDVGGKLIGGMKTGDNGWITTPRAVKLPDGRWRMYYVGNLPPKGAVIFPHDARTQVTSNEGQSWDTELQGNPNYPNYNAAAGMASTGVDPDVLYLNPARGAKKYRMFYKGKHNFYVSDSFDGLTWSGVTKLGIGKWYKNTSNWVNNLGEDEYTHCYDPAVIRIPKGTSADGDVFMYYNHDPNDDVINKREVGIYWAKSK